MILYDVISRIVKFNNNNHPEVDIMCKFQSPYQFSEFV